MSAASKSALRTRLRTALSPAMFYLSLSFLALVASLLVLWIDVPRVVEFNDLELTAEFENLLEQSSAEADPAAAQAIAKLVDEEHERAFQSNATMLSQWCLRLLAILWLLVLIEQAAYLLLADSWQQYRAMHPFALAICLCPPLRLCARHWEAGGEIWLPGLGWQVPTRNFQSGLERHTSVPMIGIALLILPVLGLQMIYGPEIVHHPWLRVSLHVGAGLIWFAFATEFLVMVSVTDKKLRYCKKHWLDLVIILLPLVSFLRSWQLLRASKLIKFSKLQQLSKVVRVYRLRGVSMRALRAFLVLGILQRILRTKPHQQLAKLEEDLAEKEAEVAAIREEIELLRNKIATAEAEQATSPTPTTVPLQSHVKGEF